MFIRLICLFAALALFTVREAFAAADNVVFQQCLDAEMEQLTQLKNVCRAQSQSDAGASANPGVGSPDSTNGEGLAADCINRAQAALTKSAQAKCTERARGVMVQRANDGDAEVPDGVAGSGGSCVPAPGRTCPSKAPLPPRRPSNLGQRAPAPRAAVPTPPPRSTTPADPQPRQQTPPAQARRDSVSTPTDRANQQAVRSARETTPEPPSMASGDASGDISLCENSYSAANRCCGNPQSCVGELSYQDQANYAQMASLMHQGPSAGGLTDYCQQMQSLGGGGGSVNSALAGVCNSKQMSCNMVCSQLAQKYQTLMANCGNCESYGIYQNTYQQLSSRTQNCQAFVSRVSQISNQAIGSSASGAYGNLCSNVAGANPQTSGMTPSAPVNNNMSGSSSTQLGGCAANPNSTACQAAQIKPASGSAQFSATEGGDTSAKKKGRFDVPSLDEVFTERVLNTPGPAAPGGVKTKTVANNTGGAIPGLEGGSPASLGPNGNRPSAGSPGYSTDILQGTQGGDGYSSPAGQAYGGEGRGMAAYGGMVPSAAAAGNDGAHLLGMDLKQFLPGGRRDPQRRLAGLGPRSEINSKEEDIWRRISSKMEEKCKLGVLIGCR